MANSLNSHDSHNSHDSLKILQVVEEFKIWSNPARYSVVRTRSFEVRKFKIPTQLKKKHLHAKVTFQNSYDLSVKRLVRWPDLEKNTVFKQPPYLLWLRRDGLLVSPYPLDCYVVHLVKDPRISENIGPKWAIFSDKAPYHFFEKSLEVYACSPPKVDPNENAHEDARVRN